MKTWTASTLSTASNRLARPDAFTIGSAYALRLEAETGTVTPGKLADLAVLDRDPFDPAAGPIADARVLATLVEGDAVHADPSLDLPG